MGSTTSEKDGTGKFQAIIVLKECDILCMIRPILIGVRKPDTL